MDLKDKIVGVLGSNFICDNCLGRIAGNLLSGYSNEQRGRTLRTYIAMLIDSGENLKVKPSNLHGIRFRSAKPETAEAEACSFCGGFFSGGIDAAVEKIMKRLQGIEFDTFLVGSVLSDELLNMENQIWERVGIDTVESLKSEINREVGKRLERLNGKKFDLKSPDVTVVIDLKNDRVSVTTRSLFVAGGYKKLVRGVPQTRWICSSCGGKGCVTCRGKGQLYPTSVQEIVEKPLLKASGGKKSFFHGSGREDIDARCLDWRPFIIEMAKPAKRRIDLKKAAGHINKSKKVKVSQLKIVSNGREEVRILKSSRIDKTYLAEVLFSKKIERKSLPSLKKIMAEPILQQTPTRVLHRRSDKFRKRSVKKLSWKLAGSNKMLLTVRTEAGLYIKELISGDNGRTKPSVAELINNKVKKINLDVIKIHVK